MAIVAAVLASAISPIAQTPTDAVTVDVGTVLNDVRHRPVGVNVNYFVDDDANRPGARSWTTALGEMNARYLRYPGGEKSDGYLWSVAPFARPQPRLARWASGTWSQNKEWPSYDRDLILDDGLSYRFDPLDFDEFMEGCRQLGCEPVLVVAYDSMYKPAQTGGVAPTRQQLLDTAREWVRYANVTRGYGVKYWEIGNESHLRTYNGGATPANYGRDLVEFSQVMKSVDPTIRIGANGDGDAWWKVVLPTAAPAIDFLAVHSYPSSGWGGYDYYKNNDPTLARAVSKAQSAINTYAPPADRARLRIAVTETGAMDWSGGWGHDNDMGHALALFEIVGRHLRQPSVEFTQVWNTRWHTGERASTPSLWDALDRDNRLQASGRVMAIWGQFLKEQMVSASHAAMVKAYATYAPGAGKLTVFLVNKDTSERYASVALRNYGVEAEGAVWVLRGSGPEDLYPSWSKRGAVRSSAQRIGVNLPPVSISVLDLVPLGSGSRPYRAVTLPGRIEAEHFDIGPGGIAYADTTAGNSGAVYRSTDVDIQATKDAGGGYNVGWIAAGEWLQYTVDVAATGSYTLSLRVATRSSGKRLRVEIDGVDRTGVLYLPAGTGWQDWKTVTVTGVPLAAGTRVVRVRALTNGFNLNWLRFTQ